MAKITNTVRQFKGYINSVEITNIPDTGYLVAGSRNVVISKNRTVAQRSGYEEYATYDGNLTGGSKGVFAWETSRGDYLMLKKVEDQILLRMGEGNNLKWVEIPNHIAGIESNSIAQFAKVWDTTDLIDRVVFSAGGDKRFFSWSGILATVDSVDTVNNTVTFTKDIGLLGMNDSGTNTMYFFSDGSKSITYTAGSGDTITSVSGDIGDLQVGDILTDGLSQHLIHNDSPDDYIVDAISVFDNRVYLGSNSSFVVMISEDSDHTSFSTSSTIGKGKRITLDDACLAFVDNKKSMLAFGRNSSVFEIVFQQSADLTQEMSNVTRLVTAPQQGLISPQAQAKVKDALLYISKNKALENVKALVNDGDFGSRTLPLSTSIENDFFVTNFKGASVTVWDNNIIVLAPEDNIMYVFDNDPDRMFWQSPLQFSGIVFGHLSVDENGDLIAHDRDTPNSYRMFDGRDDNGLAIESEAVFAYQDFGNRYGSKQLTAFAQDGYISANGVLERFLDFDFEGSRGSIGYSFRGDEMDYIYTTDFESGGLGKAPLGERTLGGSTLVPAGELRRFRYTDSIPMQNQHFYELRVRYRFKTLSGTWELASYGNDAKITNDEMTDITRPNPQIVVV